MPNRRKCQPTGALLPELRIDRPLRRQSLVEIRGFFFGPRSCQAIEVIMNSHSIPTTYNGAILEKTNDCLIDARPFSVGFLTNSFRQFWWKLSQCYGFHRFLSCSMMHQFDASLASVLGIRKRHAGKPATFNRSGVD